jgi:hypothetical protein
MSSADLHVIEFTLKRGFDSFRAHHVLKHLYPSQIHRAAHCSGKFSGYPVLELVFCSISADSSFT